MGHLTWGLLTQSFAGMSKYMPAQHISDAERKFSLLCMRQHESADLATLGLEPEEQHHPAVLAILYNCTTLDRALLGR